MIKDQRVNGDRERHMPSPKWFEKREAVEPLNVCNGSIPERQLSRNEPAIAAVRCPALPSTNRSAIRRCLDPVPLTLSKRPPMAKRNLDEATLGEVVEMALSDAASFANIEALHGLNADQVRAVMRQTLRSGSYRAWRKRVREFSDRREIYK